MINMKYHYMKNQLDLIITSKFILDEVIGCIYLTMLSNENIIISGRKYIAIYKKEDNSNYSKHQNLVNSEWGEIVKIKELKNGCFGVCGIMVL